MTDDPPARWSAGLAVRSTSLTPARVTEALGLEPTTVSTDPHRRWPYLWVLGSGVDPEADLDDHLAALVARCRPCTAAIAALAGTQGTRVVIDVTLRVRGRPGAPFPPLWLPPDVLRFVADAGLGIDVDGYLV